MDLRSPANASKQIAAKAHGLMPLLAKPAINSSPTCNDRTILGKKQEGLSLRSNVMWWGKKNKAFSKNLVHVRHTALRRININPHAACAVCPPAQNWMFQQGCARKEIPGNIFAAQKYNAFLFCFAFFDNFCQFLLGH